MASLFHLDFAVSRVQPSIETASADLTDAPCRIIAAHEGTVFEGRLVNRENGEYKGYPLDRDEWPAGIEEFHADHVRD